MQREQLANLIKYHLTNNDNKFITTAKEISRDIKNSGDVELSSLITNMLRKHSKLGFSSIQTNEKKLYTTKYQKQIFQVIVNSVNSHLINKIFIHGRPGTGKTLFVNEIANAINKDFHIVNLSQIIDSKLGESIKNIESEFRNLKNHIIFIDEVDSIAASRGSSRDLHEISRILNKLLEIIDSLDSSNILIVATNLPNTIDSAFKRRFDISINFDIYTEHDLQNIKNMYLEQYSIDLECEFVSHYTKLLCMTYKLWTPVYIQKIIKIFYIWNASGIKATDAILNLMVLMGIGENSQKIAINMKEHNVPLRTISYFTGIQKDIVWKKL